MDSTLPRLSRAREGRSQLSPEAQLVRAAPTEPHCTKTTWTHPQLNDPAPCTGTDLGQSRRSAHTLSLGLRQPKPTQLLLRMEHSEP